MHASIHVYLPIYLYTCVHSCVYICTCIYRCITRCTYICVYAYRFTHIEVCTRIDTYVYIYIDVYVSIYTDMHDSQAETAGHTQYILPIRSHICSSLHRTWSHCREHRQQDFPNGGCLRRLERLGGGHRPHLCHHRRHQAGSSRREGRSHLPSRVLRVRPRRRRRRSRPRSSRTRSQIPGRSRRN